MVDVIAKDMADRDTPALDSIIKEGSSSNVASASAQSKAGKDASRRSRKRVPPLKPLTPPHLQIKFDGPGNNVDPPVYDPRATVPSHDPWLDDTYADVNRALAGRIGQMLKTDPKVRKMANDWRIVAPSVLDSFVKSVEVEDGGGVELSPKDGWAVARRLVKLKLYLDRDGHIERLLEKLRLPEAPPIQIAFGKRSMFSETLNGRLIDVLPSHSLTGDPVGYLTVSATFICEKQIGLKNWRLKQTGAS